MTQLLDTCVAALLVSDCRDRQPLHRLQRATRRVEQLLAGIGFPETAKTLRQFREDCGPIAEDPPREEPVTLPAVADPREEDVLAGRKTRRKAVAGA